MSLVAPVLVWYEEHRRDLPWRAADRTPWGVLVSEVMLQQTPVVRVLPVWRAWQERWPGPRELASARPDEVLRAWGRLGYPRRALRLHACAVAVVEEHGGVLPDDEATLRTLPGIGEYTAAAVAAFAFGRRSVVLDTNIRRVLARAVDGAALPAPHLTRAERDRAAAVVPADEPTAARWNAAVMELGALVCTARNPGCDSCPLADRCAWLAEGRPADALAETRRRQAWHGTDRQARGTVMGLLRDAPAPVPHSEVVAAWPDREQLERALAGLTADGLVERHGDLWRLPRGGAR
ncbi:A/G-specific adenine glycosylase [Actinotalea sp. M2MS4P-6]|uniref:A/G-specific adenine glycosylase n=1 Tax=Actinotalea sp. M2MS4P-6 TaxID=2983762 RepID=UPI0021E4DC24|nr:A/G-specific adenine glycosylase [Actinotalea sp. M2MS4P-6]MCV2393233.1 A/G-specific adenine glycosylase [Actinotalea sp. M2MS4P-6]